jgi:hypothetical protein
MRSEDDTELDVRLRGWEVTYKTHSMAIRVLNLSVLLPDSLHGVQKHKQW